MSIADEQQFPMDQTNEDSNKKPRVSYTREFLLSLSDKDVCNKLPHLPTEFNDLLFFRDSVDPSPSGFVSQGLRRNDYSSSPPTRPRGGRWEGRSGGWNDKDSDSSHSDRDPGEPGRRSSRRPWQSPEHDGLLGKGSFPKPPGFNAGPSGSASRPHSNDSYQLSKTNEPYHPPRPYKAPPFTRRDTRDSLNDETFGSSDSTTEDRAEDERKRRASFELLRKEHQKVFQERQKSNPDLRKNDFDFTELLGDEKERPSRSDQVNNNPSNPGHSFPSQSNAPRPLVPPGFASTVLERKQGDKPHAETSQHECRPLDPKGINMVNGTSVTNEEKPSVFRIGSGEEAVRVNSSDTSEDAINLSSFLGISTHTVEKIEQASVKKSLEISDEPSILDKIFNTAINLNSGDSNITQKIVERVEEKRSPQTVKSSKFAHLFLEEDNKPVEDLPSSRPPGGILSLTQGADKVDTKATDELSMDFSYQGHATKNIDKSSASRSVTAAPPVLTCEDLEQSILSEVSESYHPPPPPSVDQDLSVSSVKKTNQRKTSVDNQASQHLLSLLQRNAEDPKSQDRLVTESSRPPPPSVKLPTAGEADPGKSLTLENLFGSAFMNELQSIGEPVSGRTDAPGVPLRSERSMGELSQRNQMRPDSFPQGLLGFPEDGNLSSPGVTFNISDKLAALNSGPRIERPIMGGPFLHHQYATDPSSHLNGSGPVFHPLDARHAHVKPQLDFMGQGSIIAQHQDPPPSMVHRPPFHHSATSGLPEFDRLPPHMMHMQDSLQRHHLMQGFPNGGPPHHHSPNVNNQIPGFNPELNPSQGFPFAHHQPGYGMPPPGSQGNRVDHPASLNTLLGIHQRMDPSKQSPAMGQELDLGFGYR